MPSRPAATRRRSGCIRRAAPARRRVRPPAARHGRLRGAVRQGRARHRPRRSLLQRREAVFRVRPRQRAVFSVLGRRDGDSLAGAADAAERVRGDRAAPADAVLLRADRLRDAARAANAAPRIGGRLRSVERPPRRVGGRGAAGRALRALQAALRRRHPRRHRIDRGAAHVHLESARTRSGQDRAA